MFGSDLKFCVKFKYQSDYNGKAHSHPCYELVYYISGQGVSEIDGKSYKFKPNTFCLIPPDAKHKECGNGDTEVVYIGFLLNEKKVQLDAGLYADESGEILFLMEKIYKEFQDKEQYHSHMMNLLTETIVVKLLRTLIKGGKDKENEMDYIINFIKLNFMKNLNVKDLAESISYSYDYFRHKFLEKMGVTAKEYIARERFRYAKELLMNSECSIKETAALSGYSSPSHLTMVFKKELGITPAEFVKMVKKEQVHREVIVLKE